MIYINHHMLTRYRLSHHELDELKYQHRHASENAIQTEISRLRRLVLSSLNRRFKWKPNPINQAS